MTPKIPIPRIPIEPTEPTINYDCDVPGVTVRAATSAERELPLQVIYSDREPESREMVEVSEMAEIMDELVNEKIGKNQWRFTHPDTPGFSVIVEARPNFMMSYEVYEGESKLRAFLDDQTQVEDAVVNAFIDLRKNTLARNPILSRIKAGEGFFTPEPTQGTNPTDNAILVGLLAANRIFLKGEAKGRKGKRTGTLRHYVLCFDRSEIHEPTDYDC
jgi:hypothetical protein